MVEETLAIKLSIIVHGQCKDDVPHDIGLTLQREAERYFYRLGPKEHNYRQCGASGHYDGAKYCYMCGGKL